MFTRDHINRILENGITRRLIIEINSNNGIATSEPKGAGTPEHRELPRGRQQRISARNDQRAPVVLSRRNIKVCGHGNGPGLEVGVGGRALRSGDLLGLDVWLGRDAVVEDVDLAEAGGGGGGDGGGRDAVHGVVGAEFVVVDVEVELCDVFVAFGEGLDPWGGGAEEEEVGGYQHKTCC